jgi:hypothetical protein
MDSDAQVLGHERTAERKAISANRSRTIPALATVVPIDMDKPRPPSAGEESASDLIPGCQLETRGCPAFAGHDDRGVEVNAPQIFPSCQGLALASMSFARPAWCGGRKLVDPEAKPWVTALQFALDHARRRHLSAGYTLTWRGVLR